MPAPPAISIKGLKTTFGTNVVHNNLDLEIASGEVMAIVGGSGTGKSVLLRQMLALTRPAAGKIKVLGKELRELTPPDERALRAKMGVLFQDGALFSSLTVSQNVQVPLKEQFALSRDLLRELAGLKLSLVGLPPDAGPKYPSELSGGMRKRAGLARALALDPEILFLDEPTAGLDPIGAAAFDDLVLTLQRSLGLTVVMITHDLDSLVRISDQIAVLIDKKTITGTLDQIRNVDHPWIKDYFSGPRGRAASTAVH